MSDVRCRACGAAVPTAAQWCSLCFADLRQPAPVREPVSVPAAPESAPAPALVNDSERPAAVAALATVSAPVAAPVPDAGALAAAAVAPAGRHAGLAGDEARWPCPHCGATVPISLDSCNSCGAGFLAGATSGTSARLPVVGDVGKLSRTQRLLFGAAVALAVMLLLVLVATVVVKVF